MSIVRPSIIKQYHSRSIILMHSLLHTEARYVLWHSLHDAEQQNTIPEIYRFFEQDQNTMWPCQMKQYEQYLDDNSTLPTGTLNSKKRIGHGIKRNDLLSLLYGQRYSNRSISYTPVPGFLTAHIQITIYHLQ